MIAGVLDVLLVSDADVEELSDLRTSGLEVERTPSVIAAVVRLKSVHAGLVVVGCDVCEGAGVAVVASSPPRRVTKNSPRTATTPTIAYRAGRGSCVVTA